jgi:uroporphyrinogen decarboxylase
METRGSRRETMSSAERMGAILGRERPDRVPFMPFIFGFCARNVGYSLRDFYGDETAGYLPIAIEFARIQEKFGMPITVKILPAFTCAGNITEVDVLCRWIIRRPEVVHKLMRKITDFARLVIDYYVDAFAGQPMMASVGDATSANQVISPGQFEEFVLPYQKEIHEHAVEGGIEHIFCHICGEQNLNLPYWVQIPFGNPGILSFGHEVDLETAIEYLGDQHAIAGNIEPRVIQEGSWQEVYELCRIAIAKAKYAPSGYLLMAGCEVPVQTPPYNLYVMRKAVSEFGFYGEEGCSL